MKPNMGDMCEMAGKSAKNGITEGVIWKQILIFFFPILIGTFFQQLYNTDVYKRQALQERIVLLHISITIRGNVSGCRGTGCLLHIHMMGMED